MHRHTYKPTLIQDALFYLIIAAFILVVPVIVLAPLFR
jgi:hypothetical protein